jgi:hypothetical protein
MSVYNLMTNTRAGEIYCAMDNNTPPAILADRYLMHKLSGDADHCLAIEEHIRDLARMYFNRPEVLTALNDMELHKSKRAPGKGGTKDLKAIGAQIRADYAAGDFEREPDGRLLFFVTLPAKYASNPGLLKIRCKNAPGAVEQVARKFERGYKRPGGSWRAR